MVLKSFLLLMISASSVLANSDVAKHGEKNFDNYFGPEDPKFKYDSYLDKINFVDDLIVNDYADGKISNEIVDLEQFFSQEFYVGVNCPDSSYKPKYHYLEYLSRLQVLSYLFQSVREHEYLSKKFSLKTSCSVDWHEIVKQCQPVSSEMKGFVRDSSVALKSLRPVIVPFKQTKSKELDNWLSSFKDKNFTTLTHYRLNHYCQKNNCAGLDDKILTKSISSICNEEQELFKELCSERDALYGVSYAPELYHLIAQSSGLRGINEDGYGAGCLARYIEQNKNNERKIFILEDIFSVLYEHNLTYSPDSPQGRLYTIGAVKEFNDKGLSGIFKIQEKVEEPIVEPIKPEIVEVNVPKFEKIVLPKFVKPKAKKKVDKKKPAPVVEKVEKKQSSFLIASEFRKNFNLDEVDINMEKFKYDYIFTLSQVKIMGPKIKDFSSLKSLKAMKKFDKLGTLKSPIPLKFIKFLIDNKLHQNLFNIINVVSDKFYIFNDIDPDNRKTDLILIRNDISTNFKWHLKILKDG